MQHPTPEKRKLYILLTRFPGLDSDALRWWTRFPYTHASIGLDEDMKVQIQNKLLDAIQHKWRPMI